MVFINAEKVQLFGGSVQIGFGVGFGVVGLFEGALGDSAFVVKSLCAFELDTGQAFVVLGLHVGLVGAGNVAAANLHQQLAFLDNVAESGFHFDDASGSDRDHWHGAHDVG